MPEAIGELKPDDAVRTVDEFIAALQKVLSIEPQIESLCRSYGNDPQSQPPELVAASEQLREAREAVQEMGRILYHVAIQWSLEKQSVTILAAGLQATPLTENLYKALRTVAINIKTHAFQKRESEILGHRSKAPGDDANPVEESKSEIVLDKEDLWILDVYAKSERNLTQEDVLTALENAEKNKSLSAKTIAIRLKQLREHSFVARPPGKTRKDAITAVGREYLSKHPAPPGS